MAVELEKSGRLVDFHPVFASVTVADEIATADRDGAIGRIGRE